MSDKSETNTKKSLYRPVDPTLDDSFSLDLYVSLQRVAPRSLIVGVILTPEGKPLRGLDLQEVPSGH